MPKKKDEALEPPMPEHDANALCVEVLDILRDAVARSSQHNAFGGPNAVLQMVRRAIEVLESKLPPEEPVTAASIECGAKNQVLYRRGIDVPCYVNAGHPGLHVGLFQGRPVQWERGR